MPTPTHVAYLPLHGTTQALGGLAQYCGVRSHIVISVRADDYFERCSVDPTHADAVFDRFVEGVREGLWRSASVTMEDREKDVVVRTFAIVEGRDEVEAAVESATSPEAVAYADDEALHEALGAERAAWEGEPPDDFEDEEDVLSVTIDGVTIPGGTIGFAHGVDEAGNRVTLAVDHRPLQAIVEALETQGSVEVTAESWQVWGPIFAPANPET